MSWRPGGRRSSGTSSGRSAAPTTVLTAAGFTLVALAVWVGPVQQLGAEDAGPTTPLRTAEPTATLVGAPDATAAAAQGVSVTSSSPLPSLAVIGDTFTSGAGGDPSGTWPELVCQRVGCHYLPAYAVSRAGYTVPGVDGLTLGQRVDLVVAARPDLVVLALGAADTGVEPEQVGRAVELVLDRLAADLPRSRVIVLSPFWPIAPVPLSVIMARDLIFDTSIQHGVPFVDVTDLFDAAHPGLVDPDLVWAGSALGPRGHDHIARSLGEVVQQARDAGPAT